MQRRLPDFLFIGPDKSGSTWLDQAFRAHPNIFVPSAKELFFFDRYFDKGLDWYAGQFADALPDHTALGELSHDYLFSDIACRRIADTIPDIKLIVCLREPIDRAFSAYLYLLKQGRTRSGFSLALQELDELIDHGRYYKHLLRYLDAFDRKQLHVAVFDELEADPGAFFARICAFLNVPALNLGDDLRTPSLKASRSRSPALTRVLRSAGWWLRDLGYPGIASRLKSSRHVTRVLFREYAKNEKPQLDDRDREELRRVFGPDITALDHLLGTDFGRLWGYTPTQPDYNE